MRSFGTLTMDAHSVCRVIKPKRPSNMAPSLLPAFYGDGWLYLAYSDGTLVRRYIKESTSWETVDTPKIKNFKLQVQDKLPQCL